MDFKAGDRFEHKRWLDSRFPLWIKKPLMHRVTRIANGVVYFKPLYDANTTGNSCCLSADIFEAQAVLRWLNEADYLAEEQARIEMLDAKETWEAR